MHSKDEEHFLLGSNAEAIPKRRTRPYVFLPSWAWLRIALLTLVSHLAFFGLGFLASDTRGRVISTQSTVPPNTHHTQRPSKATTTAIIDGIEVIGTKCGDNWQEAKALGCKWDVMASRWYAPECFDQDVVDDMLAEPQVNWNFTWYADKEHTIVVPSEKVFSGEFDKVYPNNLFHIKHCLHLWRKLHHSVVTGRPLDEDILDYEHTTHCTRMIMDWMDPDFKRHSVTSASTGTPFCRSAPLGLVEK
ncbi:hypothetical protein OQA88_5394 [Cercophora sp. LCS_1]